MRITRSLLLSTLFALVVGTATANSNPEKNSRTEIREMIIDSEMAKSLTESVTINVNFMVNDKNEIIVLSTDEVDFDDKIKTILNYKKLQSSDIELNKTYTLPVVFKV